MFLRGFFKNCEKRQLNLERICDVLSSSTHSASGFEGKKNVFLSSQRQLYDARRSVVNHRFSGGSQEAAPAFLINEFSLVARRIFSGYLTSDLYYCFLNDGGNYLLSKRCRRVGCDFNNKLSCCGPDFFPRPPVPILRN